MLRKCYWGWHPDGSARICWRYRALTALRLFGGGTRAGVIVDFVRWRLKDQFELQGFYDDDPGAGGGLSLTRLGGIADGLREMQGSNAAAVIALGTYASWRACE